MQHIQLGRRRFLGMVALAGALLLAACAPSQPAPVQPATTSEETGPPAWLRATLTDARSGDTFSIADFQGKVVLVELMAVWCPLCTDQQLYMAALQGQLGDDLEVVLISLDIDLSENEEILRRYVERQGFTWSFALAPAEVVQEIASRYGIQFLNPPSTPMLLIDRQGNLHPLDFGIKNVDTLMRAINQYL